MINKLWRLGCMCALACACVFNENVKIEFS